MADLSAADIVQQYDKCLILYKGKPHKVKQVGVDVKLLDLSTQQSKFVQFSFKDFAPPILRCGYVNIEENAVYLARKPVRLYHVGLHQNNCEFLTQASTSCVPGRDALVKVMTLECPEISNMMLGHYPTLKSAYEQATKREATYAFDRQFCVDARARVYYKTKRVGTYNGNVVEFERGFEYLSVLLGGEHEKATRTFRQA